MLLACLLIACLLRYPISREQSRQSAHWMVLPGRRPWPCAAQPQRGHHLVFEYCVGKCLPPPPARHLAAELAAKNHPRYFIKRSGTSVQGCYALPPRCISTGSSTKSTL